MADGVDAPRHEPAAVEEDYIGGPALPMNRYQVDRVWHWMHSSSLLTTSGWNNICWWPRLILWREL